MPTGEIGPGGAGDTARLLREIRSGRSQLPAAHRNLLTQISTREIAIDDWPEGLQDLYRSINEQPPGTAELAGAAAVWLDDLRTVAFNASLLHELTNGLSDESREEVVARISWHEYGHALSLTMSTAEQRNDGVRLLNHLPDGMRKAIDYPGSYRRLQVFDEVIATLYALMIARVRTKGYGPPEFLHSDVFDAFKEVIPWPPAR
jgi:hypothetical protein